MTIPFFHFPPEYPAGAFNSANPLRHCLDVPSKMHQSSIAIPTNPFLRSSAFAINFISNEDGLIRTENQLVGAYKGQKLFLECHSEAYPKPITYWTKPNNETIINGSGRFNISYDIPFFSFFPQLAESPYFFPIRRQQFRCRSRAVGIWNYDETDDIGGAWTGLWRVQVHRYQVKNITFSNNISLICEIGSLHDEKKMFESTAFQFFFNFCSQLTGRDGRWNKIVRWGCFFNSAF